MIVGSDGYTVTTIGFVSASYVSPEAAELANIIPEGSSACIVSVAQREYGVAPNDDGTTKYGIWFEAVCDTGTDDKMNDYTAAPWCSMFVSWCAYQANVPEYLIPYTAWCPDWANFYKNEGRYYHSACGGGSYTPQPGDLIFIGVNGADDTFDSPGHVGIVTLVGSGVVYYMEGNTEYYNSDDVAVRQVWASSMSLTSTDILAYGSPYYNLDSHSFAYWEYDDTMHWSTCMACDTERIYPHDLFEYGAGFACYGCEYTSN